MRRSLSLVLVAALAGTGTGCSTAPVNLALTQPATLAARARSAGPARALIAFAPIVDQRPEFSQQAVGIVGGREVRESDLLLWISRSLGSLQGREFTPVAGGDAAAWQIKPILRQFYTASLAVSKNANIVIELEIHPPNGPPVSRIYRGRITAVNWWNTSGEIEQSVRRALEDCLQRMAADLDAFILVTRR